MTRRSPASGVLGSPLGLAVPIVLATTNGSAIEATANVSGAVRQR